MIDAFGHVVIQAFSQLLNITTEILQDLFILGLPETDRQTAHIRGRNRESPEFPISTEPQRKLYSVRFVPALCVCVQTLIRNLRDSSTRVMLVSPALWQMDTVLVDQAVEKFNLKRNNTRKMYL